MKYRKRIIIFLLVVSVSSCFLSCSENKKPPENDVVDKKEKVPERLSEDIQSIIEYASKNQFALNDSVKLRCLHLDSAYYGVKNYDGVWSNKTKWRPIADSLFFFIDSCKYYGLFSGDYHYNSFSFIRRILHEDTIAQKNVALWARADVLMTDAFFGLVKDIKRGRLPYDSITLRKDTVLHDSVFMQALQDVLQSGSIASVLNNLEPKYPGYDSLKRYARDFLAHADFAPFTYLHYPYKDSVVFFDSLQKRLFELHYLRSDSTAPDTAVLKSAIKRFQKAKDLKPSGKVDEQVVDALNETDLEKFKRIAITLDRYKLLPDSLPKIYIWVNLPAFNLKVIDSDTVVFQSRVIVGKPDTRTPLLSSEISNFITYPQWTVPNSIIFKEMLPQIKKNVDYLKKQNLIVFDEKDEVVDPVKIKWARLSKRYFPYQLKQQEGDNNSLGVIKFNFRNKYSVYMHDTNVRYMFGKAFRALSHGCVRVQQWQKLSDFLIRNDTLKYHPDTLRAWIKRQEKHVVSGFQKVPVFFRYYTCEGKNGHVKFYDDIYGEDKFLREKYFAGKTVN
ncbi:MAG: L,D-transpeptidase family protein [Bacteroidetes bacterium]|nr:L,D-transpeptidase family protein [Bacteroidota bacterium]MBS1973157.1 L,D-transpeptidase family protein [Bacteroidota bacterium]